MPRPMFNALMSRLDAEARRSARIETRLVRLMEHSGLDRNGVAFTKNITR